MGHRAARYWYTRSWNRTNSVSACSPSGVSIRTGNCSAQPIDHLAEAERHVIDHVARRKELLHRQLVPRIQSRGFGKGDRAGADPRLMHLLLDLGLDQLRASRALRV